MDRQLTAYLFLIFVYGVFWISVLLFGVKVWPGEGYETITVICIGLLIGITTGIAFVAGDMGLPEKISSWIKKRWN